MKTALTLLIPTRNRPDLLIRQLQHYGSLPTFRGVRVLVADSGDRPALPETFNGTRCERTPEIAGCNEYDPGTTCRRCADHGRNLRNVTMLRYRATLSLVEKILSAIKEVQTPLVVIGADDDVFDAGGLREAAEFLEANPDYASCSGQIVTVEPNGALAHYPQRSIEDALPFDRLTHHMSRYTTKWYSMQRTADVRQNYARTLAAAVDETYLGELLPSCLSVLAGKSKVLDSFYMVRRVWPERPKKMSIAELTARPEWRAETLRFGDAVAVASLGEPLLHRWLFAPKRSLLRCGFDNWQAKRRWSSSASSSL